MLKSKKTLSPFGLPVALFVGISKRLFAASAISIVLDTVEPLCSADPAEIYYRRTDRAETMGYRFALYSFLIGVTALIRAVRLLFSVFINMSVNRADMLTGDPLFPLFFSLWIMKSWRTEAFGCPTKRCLKTCVPNALI